MELLVFGHAGPRTIVFPTRQGRFFDYESWGLVDASRDRLEEGRLQLYCVDSVDSESLYCGHIPPRARIVRHQQYEAYILEEVIPLTCMLNGNEPLQAHGCSIGAYHAVNITLRHPGLFRRAIGFSGRYDLTRPCGPFQDLFDGHYDEDVYFHTPVHFLPNLNDAGILDQLRRTEVVLTVGVEDPFRESNHRIRDCLREKGIPHALHEWDGEAHRASYWRRMAKLYF